MEKRDTQLCMPLSHPGEIIRDDRQLIQMEDNLVDEVEHKANMVL